MNERMATTSVHVPEDLHRKFRVLALVRKSRLRQLYKEAMNNFLKKMTKEEAIAIHGAIPDNSTSN